MRGESADNGRGYYFRYGCNHALERKIRISKRGFSRSADSFKAVTINNKPVEVVTCVKLLGLTISNNLKWNAHIDNVMKTGT